MHLCLLFLSLVFFWGLQFSFHVLLCFFIICLGPWFFLLVIKYSFERDRINSVLSKKESWTKISSFRIHQYSIRIRIHNSNLFFVSSPQKSDSNHELARMEFTTIFSVLKYSLHTKVRPFLEYSFTIFSWFKIMVISNISFLFWSTAYIRY